MNSIPVVDVDPNLNIPVVDVDPNSMIPTVDQDPNLSIPVVDSDPNKFVMDPAEQATRVNNRVALTQFLQKENLFGGATQAADQAWNKEIWKDEDGTWSAPVGQAVTQ